MSAPAEHRCVRLRSGNWCDEKELLVCVERAAAVGARARQYLADRATP